MTDKQQIIETIQTNLDNIKDRIKDGEYLELCNKLKELHTESKPKYIKITFLELCLPNVEWVGDAIHKDYEYRERCRIVKLPNSDLVDPFFYMSGFGVGNSFDFNRYGIIELCSPSYTTGCDDENDEGSIVSLIPTKLFLSWEKIED
tara:strand:+ start:79 stop:519 length:441 start_codon:yes stop_codon:yes gene_type:complete